MEWFAQIAGSLSGLPWWAVLLVVVLSVGATKGIDGCLKLLRFWFEREKYQDKICHEEESELVRSLNERIDKLEKALTDLQRESREERIAAASLLAAEQAAHAKCQIEQEQLRGDIRVMKKDIEALQRHEIAGKQHVEKLAEVVKHVESKVSDSGLAPIPPELKAEAERFRKQSP